MSLEILQRFCAGPESDRPSIQTPFAAEWDGQVWSVGADGVRMLMLVGTGAKDPPPDDVPKVHTVRAAFTAGARAYPIDLSLLCAFVGVPLDRAPCGACDAGWRVCAECNGTRQHSCECDCGHQHSAWCIDCVNGRVLCACQKWRRRSVRRVMIGDALFDAGLVAASLADAERCEGSATWLATTPDGPHMIRGDGWMLIMMPRRIEADQDLSGYPRFALFDGVESGESRDTLVRSTP